MARKKRGSGCSDLAISLLVVAALLYALALELGKAVVPYVKYAIFFAGILALVAISYRLFEKWYFNSRGFASIKDISSDIVGEYNKLNAYISSVNSIHLGYDQLNHGSSALLDKSRWNFKRPKSVYRHENKPNICMCSRQVCGSSQSRPFQYVCKYFNIDRDDCSLRRFEGLLRSYSVVEEGLKNLKSVEDAGMDSIKTQVPFPIRLLGKKRLKKELGFEPVSVASLRYPQYIFRYVSPGGNSSLENIVTMDPSNVNGMIEYIGNELKRRKSIAGQRALLTTTFRERILRRDGFTCRKCGENIADEPNLLLEIGHIVLLSKGGKTEESNLQTLCWRCNRSKGAKIARY